MKISKFIFLPILFFANDVLAEVVVLQPGSQIMVENSETKIVTCEGGRRCTLDGPRVIIDDKIFEYLSSTSRAVNRLIELKRLGICN